MKMSTALMTSEAALVMIHKFRYHTIIFKDIVVVQSQYFFLR